LTDRKKKKVVQLAEQNERYKRENGKKQAIIRLLVHT
jgi:hypothetical protein